MPVSSHISYVLFILIFPVMFLYHLLAGGGFIPFFVGGWWATLTLIAGAVMALLLVADAIAKRVWFEHLAFAAICTLISLYAVYFRFFGQHWQSGNEPLIMNVALIGAWIGLYGVGYFWRENSTGLKVTIGSLAIMVGSSVALMNPATLSFIATERFQSDLVADYQWWALCVSVTAMVVLSYTGEKAQALTIAATLLTLYLLSSRSELYAMIGISVLWAARLLRRGRFSVVFLPVVLAVLGAAVIYGGALVATGARDASLDELGPPTNLRQVEILQGSASQSFVIRSNVLKAGLQDIRSSPVLGVYAGQLQNDGNWGDYIHNGLEAWRQYGLFGFALLLWLCGDATFRSARQWWKGDSAKWQLALYVSVFATGLLIVSKTVSWPIPAFAWGLVAGLRLARNQEAN